MNNDEIKKYIIECAKEIKHYEAMREVSSDNKQVVKTCDTFIKRLANIIETEIQNIL